MSNVIPSPNMNLQIPVTNVDPGPDFANNVNASLLTIDSHNHSAGQGVQIGPSGININADLSFLSNNAIQLRSTRYVAQVSPLSAVTDYLSLSVSGVDLYYLDGNGNAIQITKSGGVAGSNGSIGGLTSPASATYVSATPAFVFQSAANTPANIDGGSFVFRNITANSNGVTVSAPSGLAANYALKWPAALPGAQSFVTLDNAGNFAAPIAFSQGITRSNLAAVGQQVSSSSGTFSTTSSTFVSVTNLTVTITTTGRPVVILYISDSSGNPASVGVSNASGGTVNAQFNTNRADGSMNWPVSMIMGNSSSVSELNLPPGSFNFIDTNASAGTHTYSGQMLLSTGAVAFCHYVIMVAYEL